MTVQAVAIYIRTLCVYRGITIDITIFSRVKFCLYEPYNLILCVCHSSAICTCHRIIGKQSRQVHNNNNNREEKRGNNKHTMELSQCLFSSQNGHFFRQTWCAGAQDIVYHQSPICISHVVNRKKYV